MSSEADISFSILENLSERIMVINKDYSLVYANRAAQEAYTTPFSSGIHCYEYCHNIKTPCNDLGNPCILPVIFQNGKSQRIEHNHIDKDGSEYTVEIIADPVYDNQKNVIAVIESSRDITERKQYVDKAIEQARHQKALMLCSRELQDLNTADMNKALYYLREGAMVDRVYLYRRIDDPEHGICAALRYESVDSSLESMMDYENLKYLHLEKSKIKRWVGLLSRGEAVYGHVDALPQDEMDFMKQQETESILLFPVMIEGKWEGIIGFSANRNKKYWNKREIELLKIASETVSSYLGRVQAKERLDHEHNKLIAFFDSMDEIIYVSDPENYDLLYINQVFKNDWTYNSRLKCYQVLQGRDSPCPFCTNHLLFGKNQEKTHIWEYINPLLNKRFRCMDRSIKWINDKYVRFEMAIDITEQYETEQALKKSEIRFKEFMSHLPGLTYIKDQEGRYVYINEIFSDKFELKKEEILGCKDIEIFSEETAHLLMSHDAEIKQNSLPKTFEESGMINGNKFSFISVKFPFSLEGNKAMGTAGISLDISEMVQIQQEKDQLTEQLRQAQKMEAVGQLTGGVAHDFNNLLQVINGYAELSMINAGDNEELIKPLSEIKKAGKRSSKLVSQLLAFSRRQIIQTQQINLNTMVSDIREMLESLLGKMIQMTFVPCKTPPLINADRSMIEQVVMNLCVNARDAMNNKGELKITTDIIDYKQNLESQWVQSGRYARLQVSDNGCGMNEDVKQRIFEPFFTTKAAGSGTGLGLSMVYGIIKQHEGFIEVNSDTGIGTVFNIMIPYSGKMPLPSDQYVSKGIQGGSERILLIEDEIMVQNFVKSILEKAGYLVFTANNGIEGIELFKTEEIDLVLTDLIMPEMGGWEAVEKIQKLNKHVKVLYMSGYTGDEKLDDEQLMDKQIIQKPFQMSDLLNIVRKKLES